MNDERLEEIRKTLADASSAPWQWAYSSHDVRTNDPELLEIGINTLPSAPDHIQLLANGQHRFWVELTDTHVVRDVIFDLDFIESARQWVPELLAEVVRLRGLLGRNLAQDGYDDPPDGSGDS